ncbi:protein of unknown function [Trichlorobacter ammonificans]|uniref:Uncharacterized protein n=1 Tax=Trichlorobacter ammonificans TaxID=2916410 RepID=A0ABN8HK60_9BACT|nr:protein of unknown function [Trichlorobacter ammonificans]
MPTVLYASAPPLRSKNYIIFNKESIKKYTPNTTDSRFYTITLRKNILRHPTPSPRSPNRHRSPHHPSAPNHPDAYRPNQAPNTPRAAPTHCTRNKTDDNDCINMKFNTFIDFKILILFDFFRKIITTKNSIDTI